MTGPTPTPPPGPGRHTATLRLDGVRDKAGFLDRCAQDLAFPAWFGRNWDALADCLRDLSWWGRPEEGFVLRVHGWDAFRTAAPEAAATAAEVFAEATGHWADRGTPLTVRYE
ncbi:barstar family protein [Streptomyces sp. NBS 14/10]|uniref:barstar family protein n=1 Tax=Streptomyces sp. NBS 14/10 TaxID=1945643 RepID=UPI000B7DA1BB|nr:barstar family protein [Streptomyces sp. NBS 14/10]KAK1178250.1 barstar family protein [Streptomyces sp. NBS 14/10]